MSHAKSPPKKDNNRENIKYNLSERYGSNSKYQKQLDMSSTFQNSTFYSEASTKTEQDKEIQSFVIEANTGFDKFETKELKNLYSRNGIHIFDVSERGRLYDGNEKGKICFKIRANNSEDFDNKVKQINNQINTMGMTIKTTKNETHRPITDVVITTNWDDTNLAKNVKKIE